LTREKVEDLLKGALNDKWKTTLWHAILANIEYTFNVVQDDTL
jgi:hypothetical protein